jgi:hypothetical protein
MVWADFLPPYNNPVLNSIFQINHFTLNRNKMNLLKSHFLYTLLVCVCLLTACEQEEPDAFNFQPYDPAPVYKNPQNPEEPGVPQPRIIREDFPNATAWRITWEDLIYNYEAQRHAYFSTSNGSLYSMSFLNSTSWQNTANVDMSLIEGFITSPSHDDHASLKYFNRTKSTAFKRTGMSAVEFADFAQNNPGMFQSLFENEPYAATDWQPNRTDPGYEFSGYYETSDLYTFKIESDPPKYGAIRVVEGWTGSPDKIVIEVVVQKDGVGGFLPKVQ